jgi:hypothetical protein
LERCFEHTPVYTIWRFYFIIFYCLLVFIASSICLYCLVDLSLLSRRLVTSGMKFFNLGWISLMPAGGGIFAGGFRRAQEAESSTTASSAPTPDTTDHLATRTQWIWLGWEGL